jgi:ATP-dependent protease HslVU (ClpYQ) peptidase subunit
MTCIIGLVVDGTVYMGADSAAVEGWMTRPMQTKKLFRNGPFLIAYCGSIRMGQILEYHLQVREQEPGENDSQYIVTGFVEAVRDCLKDKGVARVQSNTEDLPGSGFMVGYRGSLYHIGPEFQVSVMEDGFDADGLGRQFALGAMAALEGLEPIERIRRALEITTRFSNGVCAPFYVEALETKPELYVQGRVAAG